MVKLNENIRAKIIDLNNCLIDELKNVSDNQKKIDYENYFVEEMLYFLNNVIRDIVVEQFSNIDTINRYLNSIEDIEELIRFNKEVDNNLSNSFIFEEIDNELCFIKEEDFVNFVKGLTFDDEEIVELNNYLINLLYLKE